MHNVNLEKLLQLAIIIYIYIKYNSGLTLPYLTISCPTLDRLWDTLVPLQNVWTETTGYFTVGDQRKK